jgi:hypothetical protein
MKNPWGKTLRKTGLLEKRITNDQESVAKLEERQGDIKDLSRVNASKKNIYTDRQDDLLVDATAGQQNRLPGQQYMAGKRRTRRHKKHRKTTKSRRRH